MADAEKKADDDLDVPAAPKSKLVPIILAVNTLAVGGVAAFTLTHKSSPQAAEAASESHEEKKSEHEESHGGESHEKADKSGGIGPTVRLEPFVIQLRAVESERYAHLTIELEVTSEDDKNRVATLLPRIRDSIIGHLADRTADELRGSEGMSKLKDTLLEKIQDAVPGHHVVAVYVTDFIVQ